MEERKFQLSNGHFGWILGMTVSFACAIQCTLFPLLTGVLPLLGLGFLAGAEIERILLMVSVVLAIGGFCFGFRYHKRYNIFMFLVAGLALIFTGRISVDESLELPFVVSGTLLLAVGPYLESAVMPALSRLSNPRASS